MAHRRPNLVRPDRLEDAAEALFPSDTGVGPLQRPLVEELSIGFVGTYPPTKCGIATFTAALSRAMAPAGSGQRGTVLTCTHRPGALSRAPQVVAELVQGSSASRRFAAAALADVDVVVLQHEFGI